MSASNRSQAIAPAVMEAGRRFGIAADSLKPQGGNASSVFAGMRDDLHVVLKVTPADYRSPAMVRSEIEFVAFLRNHGVPAAEPLGSAGGALVESFTAEGADYAARAERRLGGRLVRPDEWTPALYEEWGRLIGRMHALAKTFEPDSADFTRPDWQEEMRKDFVAIPGDMAGIRAAGDGVIARLDRLDRGVESRGLIHGDLHQWNLLLDGGVLRPIDFDNCSWDWFAADISVVLHNVINAQARAFETGDYEAWTGGRAMERSRFAGYFMESFMEGYRRENSLPPGAVNSLPDLLRRRHISVYLDRAGEAAQAAMPAEEQAARPPYRSLAQHRSEILGDALWDLEF